MTGEENLDLSLNEFLTIEKDYTHSCTGAPTSSVAGEILFRGKSVLLLVVDEGLKSPTRVLILVDEFELVDEVTDEFLVLDVKCDSPLPVLIEMDKKIPINSESLVGLVKDLESVLTPGLATNLDKEIIKSNLILLDINKSSLIRDCLKINLTCEIFFQKIFWPFICQIALLFLGQNINFRLRNQIHSFN